jgi:CheY-like chemotaxis protein
MAQGISKALVVDDSRLARIALSKLLQKRNVEVDVVGTGTEALDYLGGERPDVVFMDYMMPDMDGFEATRRIRELPDVGRDLPVVMYTSQDTDEDRQKARELGIAGFLSKPSGEHSLDEVLTRLGDLVRTRSRAATAAAPPARTAAAAVPASRSPAGVRAPTISESSLFDETDVATGPVIREPALGPDLDVDARRPWIDEAPPPRARTEPAELPWEEIRKVARKAAAEAATEAAERAVAAASTSLREDMQGLVADSAERAREAAEAAARDVAGALAEETAEAISGKVAEDMAARLADELGPEASRRIMTDLRRDVRNYVGELFAADVFREQMLELVSDAALPAMSSRVTQEIFPKLREQLLQETIRHAEAYTVQAAREESREALEEMLDPLLERRLEAFGARAESRARELARQSASRVRTQLLLGAVVLGAAVTGVLFWLLGPGL